MGFLQNAVAGRQLCGNHLLFVSGNPFGQFLLGILRKHVILVAQTKDKTICLVSQLADIAGPVPFADIGEKRGWNIGKSRR